MNNEPTIKELQEALKELEAMLQGNKKWYLITHYYVTYGK